MRTADGGGVQRLDIDGRPLPDGVSAPTVQVIEVASSYFAALGVPLIAGRDFSSTDGVGAPPRWLTIVGLAPEIRQQGPGGRAQHTPIVYLPIAAAAPATSILLVRHAMDPVAIAGLSRAEVQAIDPNIPRYRRRTLTASVRDAMWNQRVSAYRATTVCLLNQILFKRWHFIDLCHLCHLWP